jgi:hypothetical protein
MRALGADENEYLEFPVVVQVTVTSASVPCNGP